MRGLTGPIATNADSIKKPRPKVLPGAEMGQGAQLLPAIDPLTGIDESGGKGPSASHQESLTAT